MFIDDFGWLRLPNLSIKYQKLFFFIISLNYQKRRQPTNVVGFV